MIGEKQFSSCYFVQKFSPRSFRISKKICCHHFIFCDAELSYANVYVSKGRGYSSDTKKVLIAEIH